jgi:hypothetical protein
VSTDIWVRNGRPDWTSVSSRALIGGSELVAYKPTLHRTASHGRSEVKQYLRRCEKIGPHRADWIDYSKGQA